MTLINKGYDVFLILNIISYIFEMFLLYTIYLKNNYIYHCHNTIMKTPVVSSKKIKAI